MTEADLAVAAETKGFLDDAEGQRLYELARDHAHLGPIIEVGSYCGKSSVFVGAGARDGGGVMVCIDHHRGNEEQQRGELYHDDEVYDPNAGQLDSLRFLRDTLRKANVEDHSVVMVTQSTTASSLMPGPFGMVFIDGGHTFEAAEADLAAWSDKVIPGGILCIHDLFPNPDEGGQAPITIYRKALATGNFDELETTKTLGVMRRK